MKYGELIQFEPLETIVQLKDANAEDGARKLVSSYVISDKMAGKINDLLIRQLQFEQFADNKALWVIGNYGSGKSHLLSVVSAVAQYPGLADEIHNESVREAARQIEGKFKVIRFEIDVTKMELRDIIINNLQDGLSDLGVDYEFPSIEQISSSHKPYFEEMMAKFHELYPDQGLLLVCDELLDYLNSRNQQELAMDLGILRTIGEVIKDTRFRFIAGVQEAIFDSPKLTFVSNELRRIKDRAEQVLISTEDIKFVVAERLLKKSAQQQTWIRDYLQKFTKFYAHMNERLDEFVHMFPVHPDYLSVFEQISGIENRQALKSLSISMTRLMEKDVPEDIPGVFSYDAYWEEILEDKSYNTQPDVERVLGCYTSLADRIRMAYPVESDKPFAMRIINALAIRRLTFGDITRPIGVTAAELRDSLCLFIPKIVGMGGDDATNLEKNIFTTIVTIAKTVNGQFITRNKENNQVYLDVEKVDDFDALIEQRADALTDDQTNNAYRAAMLEILEQTDSKDAYTQMWRHELRWPDKNVTRPGWLFLGSPNERETAKPPLDYYLYFIQPKNPPKLKKQYLGSDEVMFRLKNTDEEFNQALKFYAAAIVQAENSTAGNAQTIYRSKATGYLQAMVSWLNQNRTDAYEVQHKDQTRPMMDWLAGQTLRSVTGSSSNETLTLKEVFEAIASVILNPEFNTQAPEYPTFSQYITADSIDNAAKDVLNNLSGGVRTRRATAVMDALQLLDADKLAPRQSQYAKTILEKLESKPAGQVVNYSELLKKAHEQYYFEPESYRLEAQWLIVLLASLVYAGEIELAITGERFDASKIKQLADTPLDDLTHFKHIQAPKDFNVKALKALLNLLGMQEGLATSIQQGDEAVVRDMMDQLEKQVRKLVQGQQLLKDRLPLWGQHALEEEEANELKHKLESTKQFLESLQRYNTPGKLKNLKVTPEEIESQADTLESWAQLKQLTAVVNDLKEPCNYLSQAQRILPPDHSWQESVKSVRQTIREGLADKDKRLSKGFKSSVLTQLEAVAQTYRDTFVQLYNNARLTLAQDKQKAALMNDERLHTLDKLAGIDLMPSENLSQWRHEWASLKVAEAIDPKVLAMNPQPVDFSPVNESSRISAASKLDWLDSQLDILLSQWTGSLSDNLADPFIQMDLLKPEQKQQIEQFLKDKQLPAPLELTFIEAVNQLLTGLEPVNISQQDLIAKLGGKGTPLTTKEAIERFTALIENSTRGKEKDKVRIIFE